MARVLPVSHYSALSDWRRFQCKSMSLLATEYCQTTTSRRFEKVKVRRFLDRINAIQVIVDFQHQDSPHVELNVSAEHAPDFVASAQSTTVLSALDAAVQKVEQQLRKYKEKLTEHKAAGVKHITPAVEESE